MQDINDNAGQRSSAITSLDLYIKIERLLSGGGYRRYSGEIEHFIVDALDAYLTFTQISMNESRDNVIVWYRDEALTISLSFDEKLGVRVATGITTPHWTGGGRDMSAIQVCIDGDAMRHYLILAIAYESNSYWGRSNTVKKVKIYAIQDGDQPYAEAKDITLHEILAAIPTSVVQSYPLFGPRIKKRYLRDDNDFYPGTYHFFPSDFPASSPIVISEYDVAMYCNLAAVSIQEYEIALPFARVSDATVKKVESILDHRGRVALRGETAHDFIDMEADEMAMTLDILHHLGVSFKIAHGI